MKYILTFIFIMILSFMIIPRSVLAADDDSDGYDDNDYAKLQAFLDLPSAVSGKTNGQCINASYNRNNPATWTGVVWNTQTPKRVATIGLSYTWWNKSLGGALDLAGFTSLTTLECGANQITALNLDGDTALASVQCFTNKLVSLDISTNTALTYLLCSNNALESVTLSGAGALATLNLNGNRLTALDISGVSALTELSCGNNPITTLDISHNTALETLKCYSTNISTLDISANNNLEVLQCFYSAALSSINLDGADALTELSASNCALTSVDVSHNPNLIGLYIYDNQIDSLDVTHNPELKYLYCENNRLTSLNLRQNSKLVYLYCDHNQISSMDISTCTVLNNLRCNDNRLTSLDASASTEMFSLGCAENPLSQIDAVINGHAVSVTANGSGYVEVSYHCWGPYTYHARAYPQEGTKLCGWTSAGAVVSTAADYVLSTGSSYDLTADFTYTVTFDRNEGDIDADPAALEVVSGTGIPAMPEPPVRGGYLFGGWFKEPACINAWYCDTDAVTGDLMLYAKWMPLTLSSSDEDGTIYTGGRVTLTPSVDGGEWDWDGEYFSATFNSPATFTALKAGISTIAYTADGQTVHYEVTIEESDLPSTGQNFTGIYVLCGIAAALSAVATGMRKRTKRV